MGNKRKQHSAEAQAYRHLYKTAAWQRIRQEQLTKYPLCGRCLARGNVVPATIVHHVEKHNGNPVKFYAGPLESLCKTHHDSDAQSEERRGYSIEVGLDGWPVDPRHPANSRP